MSDSGEGSKRLFLVYESALSGRRLSYEMIIDGGMNEGSAETCVITTAVSNSIDLSKMKKDIRLIFNENNRDGYDILYLHLTDEKYHTIGGKTLLPNGSNCFWIRWAADGEIEISAETYSEECAQNAQKEGNVLTAEYIAQCLGKESVAPQVTDMLKHYKRVLSFICHTKEEKAEYEEKLDALLAKITAQGGCEGCFDELNDLRTEMESMIRNNSEWVHSYQRAK